MLYYGYRFYITSAGRMANRDMLQEVASPNLYMFLNNNPINNIELLGLEGANSSDIFYSIYSGFGPSLGNKAWPYVIDYAKEEIKNYTCNGTKTCRYTLEYDIKSSSLKAASLIYDEIHLFSHAEKQETLNPNWKKGDSLKNRYISRTIIQLADGNHYLSDILTEDKDKVRAHVIVTWVCYDRYVDENNPSGIRVCKPVDNPKPNNTVKMGTDMVAGNIATLKAKKCCVLK